MTPEEINQTLKEKLDGIPIDERARLMGCVMQELFPERHYIVLSIATKPGDQTACASSMPSDQQLAIFRKLVVEMENKVSGVFARN